MRASIKLEYTDEALEASVYLSNRYISDRFLPDKAIDLIDEAGARVKLRRASAPDEMVNIQRRIRIIDDRIENAISAQEFEKAARYRLEEDLEQENLQVIRERWKLKTVPPLKVTREDIEEVIAKWTGIPVASIHEEEMSKLLRMEEELHKRIISQDKAISRSEQGDPEIPGGPEVSQTTGRLFPVPWPYGRGQNGNGTIAGRFPVRKRKRDDPARHVGIHGKAFGFQADRIAARIRRL